MITGSYPPDICGVGDYTACFMNATDANKWLLFYNKSWKLFSLFSVIHKIRKIDFNNMVIQYPTQGYRWSLLPQLLCFYYTFFTKKKVTVALHEFSQRTFKAKIASVLFFVAHKVILTNDYEKKYVHNRFYIPIRKIGVVKIISNINSSWPLKKWSERSIDLAYFGILRPEKGLEDFMTVAIQLHENYPQMRIVLIGQVLPEYVEYINNLIATDVSRSLELIADRSTSEVSELLNDTKITYLPFPDGVSERRGSFLAAVSNGTLVVSYKGGNTPIELNDIYLKSDRHSAYDSIVRSLFEQSDEKITLYQNKCIAYLKENFPLSWKEIVTAYETLIE